MMVEHEPDSVSLLGKHVSVSVVAQINSGVKMKYEDLQGNRG